MEVEEVLFDIADALRVPVLVLALLALAVVVFELGGLIAELVRRRGRGLERLDRAVADARQALAKGDAARAKVSLSMVAASKAMRRVLASIVDQRQVPGGSDRIAKDLAEFDYASIRRLERTRMLVRIGPALGLMGTLIPLSPALAGLAEGDIETLSDNLRVAFSVTVAGLLVGAIAFAISLVRDRLYGQDFSDLEYVASQLAPGVSLTPAPATTSPAAPATPAEPTATPPATPMPSPPPGPTPSPASAPPGEPPKAPATPPATPTTSPPATGADPTATPKPAEPSPPAKETGQSS